MDDQFPPNSSRSRSPGAHHLTVTDASQHGIVMEAGRPFDIGSTVALGLHVNRSGQRTSRFISAETVVVASQPRFSKAGVLVHEVTMIFSDITNRDQALLLRLSERKALRKLNAENEDAAAFGPAKVGEHGFSLN